MNKKTLDQRSDELDHKLEDNPIDKSIEAIIKADKQRHFQVKILFMSIALQTLLLIGLGFLSIQARNLAEQTANSQAAVIESCRAGNEFRATEASLWARILDSQPVSSPNRTPEQQALRDKTIEDFRQYLTTTFAPRDCDALADKK